MHTLTTEELQRRPGQLLEDADRGELAVVTRDGEPLLLVVPLRRKGLEQPDVRLELAVRPFHHEQISIGVAARIAGVSMAELMDDLGRRCIPLIRTTAEELERELAAFDD
jgi:predicted HTH domain antitoxin